MHCIISYVLLTYDLLVPRQTRQLTMPLKRTPPASPVPSTSETQHKQTTGNSDRSIQHYESAPDIPSLLLNITERKKRKHEGNDIASSLSEMFTTFSKGQEKRFDELKDSIIVNLKEQNEDLKKSVETMSSKFDEILSRVSQLEMEKIQDKKIIQMLEDKIENIEKKSKCAGIELRNMPKSNGETKENLSGIVKNVGKLLDLTLVDSDIRDIYRISSKDGSHPIVVELNSVIMKEKIISGVKKFNKSKAKGDKLNTTHLNSTQLKKPVYISETLTHNTQKLFYQARIYSKTHNYVYVLLDQSW